MKREREETNNVSQLITKKQCFFFPNDRVKLKYPFLSHIPLEDLRDTFYHACRKGDFDVLQVLLMRGFNPNYINPFTSRYPMFPGLHTALEYKHFESSKLLIRAKANPNFFCKRLNRTPLSIAINNNFEPIIPILLRAGANTKGTIKDCKNTTFNMRTIAKQNGYDH